MNAIKTVILAATLAFAATSYAADSCVYSKYKITKQGLVPATDTGVYNDPDLKLKIGEADVGAYWVVGIKTASGKTVYKIKTSPGQENKPEKVLGWVDAKHFYQVELRNCSF
jgi:hypothetical protein